MPKFYLILLMLAFNSIAAAQTADFTFNTSSGVFCAPQEVTFTQNASGTPSHYIWDFGDGTSGSNAVASHTYQTPGNYEVTFTAVYANSAASVKKTVTISPVPTITLAADRIRMCGPGIVNFTVSGSTGIITNYIWNFQDGSAAQTTTTPTISHNFTTFGSYHVTVRAVTAAGCEVSTTRNVTISKFPLTAAAGPRLGCSPINVTMITNATYLPGDGFLSATWTFGDGSPDETVSTPTTVHTYSTTQPITSAMVEVTTMQGCVNQYILDTFAYGIPPTNTIGYPAAARDTFCGSEVIQFVGKADNANLYQWNFGDGNIIDTEDTLINHRYRNLGNKTVTVRPYFNGCPGPIYTFDVYIRGVIAIYSYSNTCNAKNTFLFNNVSTGNISSFEWTFSDIPGVIESTVTSPVHTFPTVGTFKSRLLIRDDLTGCVDALEQTIYTATPSFTSSVTNVCKDSTVIFNVQHSYPSGVGYFYIYNLAGDSLNAGPNSSYTLNPDTFGIFNDYVIIRDSLAGTCDDTLYLTTNTTVRGPVMDFTFPPEICRDTAVNFQNHSQPFIAGENITSWSWDFGDGQTDNTQQPPAHLYSTSGSKIVRLEAEDINGCRQGVQDTILINALPTIVLFPPLDTLCLGESSTLRVYTADSLFWNPAPTNCLTAKCDTIVVTPTSDQLFIANAISIKGCRNADTSDIRVFTPINLQGIPPVSTVCPGVPVQLSLNANGITTWAPPLYLNDPSISDPIAIAYDNIEYSVVVQDSAGCYSDTAIVILNVHPAATVDAGPDITVPFNTAFQLTPLYPAHVVDYLWTPSDGLSCANCASPNGTATGRQEYSIEITDINGCKASDKILVMVSCEKSNLLLPNAFTPNGDGLNDWFYPITRGYKTINSFSIFNRNGFKVFERKEFEPNISTLGWDGRIRSDNNSSTQAFIWILEGECFSGEKIVTKGSVMLIR